MHIHETRHVLVDGRKVTFVLVESVANDVAVYRCVGHVIGDYAAGYGSKLTEREALRMGFTVPAGKHYRR